jgi:hypothetical protein
VVRSIKKFKVELILESSVAIYSDPSLFTEVIAKDEAETLSLAKSTLKVKYPDMNFMKIWS